MKFRNPFQSAIKRNFLKEAELKLYEKVAKDIENNDINNGVWTKAFAKSNGDVAKQKSIYIELMVELYEDRLRAEEELEVILASAANKEKAEKQKQEAQKQSRSKPKSAADIADEEAEKTRLAKEHYKEKYLNTAERNKKIREANRAKSEAIRKENKAKSEALKNQRKTEGKKDKSNLVMPILLGLVAIIIISFFLYNPAPVDEELEAWCENFMAGDDGSIDEPLMDTFRGLCK